MTLHDSRTDQYGLPIPKIHYEKNENSRAMLEHAFGVVENIYGALDAEKTYRTPSGTATHNMGTARMAAQEKDGVCNSDGRVFGVPNLFIADGSAFPTSMTANPTLTIVALAIRQARFIRQSMLEQAI